MIDDSKNVEKKLNFLKIDRKNILDFYTNISVVEIKMLLYSFISDYDNKTSEIEIYKKFLCNLIPHCEKDQSLQSNNLSKIITDKQKDKYHKYINSSKTLEIICEREYDMDYYFFYSHIEELSSVLRLNYLNLDHKYNQRNSLDFVRAVQIPIINRRNTVSSFKTTEELVFPLDFLNLSEKFQSIKTLKLFIPNKDFLIYDYILVLINIAWIFPNLLNIELELEIDSIEHNNELKNKLELILVYCYYVSKFPTLKSLLLKVPYSFENEIFSYLIHKDNNIIKYIDEVKVSEFHILDIFKKSVNLSQLDFEFNCLDSNTFQRIHSLIHLNNNIKSIKLTFFPKNEELLSKKILYGLSEKHSTPGGPSPSQYYNDNLNEEIETILGKLLRNFESNMEYLFFILSTKVITLTDITFCFDIPNIICEDDRYMTIFHKFLANIFITIEKQNNQIQSFIIDSINFPLDARKFQIVQVLSDKLNFSKKDSLLCFTFKAKFFKVFFNEHMIPPNLQSLAIGELDNDSFFSFMKILKDRSKLNKIQYLDISLNKYLFDGKKYVNELIEFFSMEKSNTLREIKFMTEIQITSDELDHIMKYIKKDNISYSLQFSKKFLFNKVIEKDSPENHDKNKNIMYHILFCLKQRKAIISKTIRKLIVRLLFGRKKSINIKYI